MPAFYRGLFSLLLLISIILLLAPLPLLCLLILEDILRLPGPPYILATYCRLHPSHKSFSYLVSHIEVVYSVHLGRI